MRKVKVPTPRPQPLFSQKPGKKGEAAFCAGVIWSVTMASMVGRDRIRSFPSLPQFIIILAKAR